MKRQSRCHHGLWTKVNFKAELRRSRKLSSGETSILSIHPVHIGLPLVNAEIHQFLEQHVLPSKQHLFEGRHCVFQQDKAKPKAWAFLPAVQTFYQIQTFGVWWDEEYDREEQHCWAAPTLYKTTMGHLSSKLPTYMDCHCPNFSVTCCCCHQIWVYFISNLNLWDVSHALLGTKCKVLKFANLFLLYLQMQHHSCCAANLMRCLYIFI